MKKIYRAYIKKLGLFEMTLIGFGIISVITFGVILFRKTTYLTITVQVTEPNVLYTKDRNPPFWYAAMLKPGTIETDSLGIKNAEILGVRYYPTETTDKIVFIKLRIRSVYNKSKNQHSYKGKPLLVGSSIRVEFQNNIIDGIIVESDRLQSPYQEKTMFIRVKLIYLNAVYKETEGSPAYIANAINIGDSMQDSNGKTILTVMEKDVEPADRYITDNGALNVVKDPLRKDIHLTLKITSQQINNDNYFLYTYKVKINQFILLELPNITFFPIITEILQNPKD